MPTPIAALLLGFLPQDGLSARLDALEHRLERLEHAAWSVGPAVLCLDVAADLSPLHPTRALPAGVCELSVAIEPDAAARFRALTAVFIAADVGPLAPPGTEMARTTQPTNGRQPARFRYRQDGPLPPGAYRVELAGDGTPWCTLPFRVRPLAASPVPAFPLVAGRSWTYAFVQEAADANELVDGERALGQRLAATVELRIQGPSSSADDPRDLRVEFLRDGQRVHEEAWRWVEGGLVATRRLVDDALLELSPPQPLLASASGVQTWEYVNRAQGFDQRGCQWGPLPLHGPWGSAAGFVVRTEQTEGDLVHVAEREFVPELGLVRERIVTARGGVRIARQELVLMR